MSPPDPYGPTVPLTPAPFVTARQGIRNGDSFPPGLVALVMRAIPGQTTATTAGGCRPLCLARVGALGALLAPTERSGEASPEESDPMSDSDGPPPLVDSSFESDDPGTIAALQEIGRASFARAAEFRAAATTLPSALTRVLASRPWAAEEGRRLHLALSRSNQADGANCPTTRVTELLAGLRATVEEIQRHGDPGPGFRWSHVVNPILWLSLPGYRGALVHLWQELHLPLYPLDVLDASLRELGLTTPAALRSWLESMGGAGVHVRTWEYIPPEIQEAAMQELGVDAITQLVIINSSDAPGALGTAAFPPSPTVPARRQPAPVAGRRPAMHDSIASPDRCPSDRAEALLGHLQVTVQGIQRDGPPADAAGWGHVGNALLWLSLPRHRAALVKV